METFAGKYLRKFHAKRILNNGIDPMIIDLFQGRQPRESAALLERHAPRRSSRTTVRW